MATAANIHAPLGAVTVLHVVDAFITAKNSILAWNEARVTRKELSKLTDAQLDDIGLTRSDVARI
ncbi:DUF1127 domain-containing protein [Ruegeria sediminis]|uniref:DUF1127 domain-containing protein n=1 Tax=Ruegeria sediminis TaxID=2583820 RepID=A0ABY2WWS9_9RHOB|nr:DUF1127 domain-containing protein [Ruegeria sediminis]TMV07214.1 DUF1127 domain-containing protein [Ruegeria sediminis]